MKLLFRRNADTLAQRHERLLTDHDKAMTALSADLVAHEAGLATSLETLTIEIGKARELRERLAQ